MTDATLRSPGGWAKGLKLLLGTLATAGAALLVYGTFNGGQAVHYCEGAIFTASGAGYNAFSCLNPLPEGQTGALLATSDEGLFVDNVPSPDSRLYVGTATTTTGSGGDVMNNVVLSGTNRFLSTTTTGSTVRTSGIILLAPRNSAGKRYLVGRYGTGSGQVASGLKVGFYRFRVFPCSGISGLSCR